MPEVMPQTITSLPSVSVVVPALNEEKLIVNTLQILLEAKPPPSEVILSDDGSSDDTVELTRRNFPSVHILLKDPSEKSNRASACNRGLKLARSQYVVFVHTDTLMPSDFVTRICMTMADPETGLGAFPLMFVNAQGRESFKPLKWHCDIKTWLYPAIIRPLSFCKGARAIFGDQSLFGRREQMLAVDGFPVVPVMEEVGFMMSMVQRFGRVVISEGERAKNSDRRFALYGMLRITLLHWWMGFGHELGIPLWFLRRFYPAQHVLEEQCLRASMSAPSWYEKDFLWREIFEEGGYSLRAALPCANHDWNLDLPAASGREVTIVDVGSCFGMFALWCDRHLLGALRRGVIHCIEPNSSMLGHVMRNARLTENAKMHCHNVALSDRCGHGWLTKWPRANGWTSLEQDSVQLKRDTLAFVLNTTWSWLHPIVRLLHPLAFHVLHSKSERVSVRTSTLSDWMVAEQVQCIDLLKIDVEKHEFAVLGGIEDTDWPKIQNIVIEAETNIEDIRRLLQQQGFDVTIRQDAAFKGTPYFMIYGFRASQLK